VTATIDPTAPRASRLRRPGRPGRAVLLLIAALAVAAASWTIGPALAGLGRPAAPADAGGTVPLPGNVAALGDAPGAGTGAVGPTADDRLPLADRRSFWAARVAARPADFLSLTQLALVEAETARSTADLGAYQRAAALIDRALAEVPAYPPTIRARGGIRFALHDFGGARADADQVLRATPDDPAALALLGDAAIELGDLDAADAAYATLATVAPGPWLDVRRARLASARGDHAGAVALARLAAADAAASDPAEAAFYAYAVGEYARLAGDAETARAGFERALAAWPDDLGALIGLARVDAAAPSRGHRPAARDRRAPGRRPRGTRRRRRRSRAGGHPAVPGYARRDPGPRQRPRPAAPRARSRRGRRGGPGPGRGRAGGTTRRRRTRSGRLGTPPAGPRRGGARRDRRGPGERRRRCAPRLP
jgi:hypothetical protein